MAITRVLLVRVAGQTFGLPLGAVVQIVRPHPTALSMVGAERVFTLDGKTYPLRDLADTLGLARPASAPTIQPVLIANLSRRRMAVAVDEIVNSRDAVVKKLGTHLKHVPGIWGATLLGDGTVVLILNPADLVGAADEPVVIRQPVRRAVEHAPYNVLVVDDSLSMRHVLSIAIEKAGWNPIPARDGLEALEIINGGVTPPDLVLLDIEMPRMDGFEFLSTIRAQKAHAALPVVMLTSRGGDKHRDKARALGVTDYMVKPFQEDVLVSNVDRLVKESRAMGRRAAS
jgi:chemosensory pili system protein ChpA (sensor histidine kinase/response regulator)